MNVAYVNPFVQGSQRVFDSVCQEKPSLGQVFLKTTSYTTLTVAVSLSFHGAFSGEVVYTMEETVGCFIASKMMSGYPVESLQSNEMAQSALCELANIISGHVATIFSGKGMLIDISPPKYLFNPTSADFPIAANIPKIVCVPLSFSSGYMFEVDVLIP